MIPPGGEGKIKISVNSNGYGGRSLVKTASAYTDDPAHRTIKFRISGKVKKFAIIKPNRIRLIGSPGEKLQDIVTITPAGEYKFSIIGKTVLSGKYINIDLRRPDPAKPVWKLTITNKRKNPGRYFDIITLKTDSKIKPFIAIRVFGYLFQKNNLSKVSP